MGSVESHLGYAGQSAQSRTKGTKNWLVPVSRFKHGRLRVAEDVVQGSHEETSGSYGFAENTAEASCEGLVKWNGLRGRFKAGDEKAVWFDSSKLHAVEEAEGDRMVIVAYTPRFVTSLATHKPKATH